MNLGIDYEAIRHANPKEGYIKQFTFNAARKSMTTVIPLPNDSGYRVLTKGASEIVLGKCTKILTHDGNVRRLYVFTQEKSEIKPHPINPANLPRLLQNPHPTLVCLDCYYK